jgi:hypothetical protein
VETFDVQLKRAKLRFHFKLSQAQYPSSPKKYYTSNNYLCSTVTEILEELNIGQYSKEEIHRTTKEKGNLTVNKWKSVVNKAIKSYRENTTRTSCKKLFSLKPTAEISTWLDDMDQCHLGTYMIARHKVWNKSEECQCDKEVFVHDPTWHLLFECTNPKVIIGRVVMFQVAEFQAPNI